MASTLVTNNAWGELLVPITATSTQILLSGGQGDRFPGAVEGASQFYVTLVDEENNLEIVRCVARTADTLTVVRGADGTTPRAFREGSRAEVRVVAQLFNDKLDKASLKPALDELTAAYKAADTSVKEEFNIKIDEIKAKYITIEEVDARFETVGDENDENFLTIEEAGKTYLPLEGGTLKGSLRIEGSSKNLQIVGGDLNLSTYSSDGSTTGGNIRAAGAIYGKEIQATSDRDAKEDIVYISDSEALQKALSIKPVEFTWRTSGKESVGVIAQDVELIVPQVVHMHNGQRTVNYGALSSILFGAVAELNKKIEELKCRSV